MPPDSHTPSPSPPVGAALLDRVGAARGAAQDGAHAGHELAQPVGLGDVVVGPHLECDDGVDLGALGGHHDDGDARAGADGPAHVDAGHLGQHQVQQEDVGIGLLVEAQRLGPVARHDDPEPLVGQSDDQGVDEGLLVLRQEHPDGPLARWRRRGAGCFLFLLIRGARCGGGGRG